MMKYEEHILDLDKARVVILALLCLLLSACITLPGHRQTVDEGDFYVHITAPDRVTKGLIRFNAEQTDIARLPAKAEIELVVVDVQGKHELDISGPTEAIDYDYTLNGRRMEFGTAQQEWFASQVPRIITKTGLKHGPD